MNHSIYLINKYKKILDERYRKLIQELEGSDASNPPVGWPDSIEKYKESHRFISDLDLRMAADDFVTALKEVKKLK